MKLLSILGVAVIGSLIAVVILFIFKAMDSKHGTAPGLVAERLAACSTKPNCVNSEDFTPPDKRVAPFPVTAAQPQQDWQKLQVSIEAQGGTLIKVTDTYLAATFTSSLFGFVDDLEARLDVDEGVIHIRSASRVGQSDFSANRTRVQQLRSRFSATSP